MYSPASSTSEDRLLFPKLEVSAYCGDVNGPRPEEFGDVADEGGRDELSEGNVLSCNSGNAYGHVSQRSWGEIAGAAAKIFCEHTCLIEGNATV